jgi:hypothetical protein
MLSRRTLGSEKRSGCIVTPGEKPRPEHVKMDGKTYNITKGMWDRIFPGELINCRCTGRPIIPVLSP